MRFVKPLALALFAIVFLPGLSTAKECRTTVDEARIQLPQFDHLDDESFVNVVHRRYYSDIPIERFREMLCYTPESPWKPRELNMVDRWRYDSCQSDASKAPTPQGVNIGMRLCREKFGQ